MLLLAWLLESSKRAILTIEAILVDFDGTLVDTEHANSIAYSEAMKLHGFIYDAESIYPTLLGRHWSAFLPDLLKEDYSPSLGLDISIVKKRIYSSFYSEIRLNLELVTALKAIKDDVSLVLVTSASKQSVVDILKHFSLQNLFKFLVCQEDVKEPKPNPECYLVALSKLKLNASKCLAIEDSDTGIQAAIAANLPVLRVSPFHK